MDISQDEAIKSSANKVNNKIMSVAQEKQTKKIASQYVPSTSDGQVQEEDLHSQEKNGQ